MQKKRNRQEHHPISRLFPNMITLGSLCCGLSAIRFAMLERWEIAVAFIIMSAILDGLDGRIARMLGVTSLFGAQLDSLSDFLCFGIAPVMVLYIWQLHEIKGLGWAVVLFFSVCAALRLARFNTGLFEEKEDWEKKFFVGVPSPAGGILCLLPLILSLAESSIVLPATLSCIHVLVMGTLMASRIPTFAGKHMRIKHEAIPSFMIACSFMLVLFIIEPWFSLSLIGLAYLVSIVFSVRYWKRLKRDSVNQSLSAD